MIIFFKGKEKFYAVESSLEINGNDLEKLIWLFGDAECIAEPVLPGNFLGPRKEMITPWSTNAVEITQNMGIEGIRRIEEFTLLPSPSGEGSGVGLFDPMLQHIYEDLDQEIFLVHQRPEPIRNIEDIASYSNLEGLALSP